MSNSTVTATRKVFMSKAVLAPHQAMVPYLSAQVPCVKLILLASYHVDNLALTAESRKIMVAIIPFPAVIPQFTSTVDF